MSDPRACRASRANVLMEVSRHDRQLFLQYLRGVRGRPLGEQGEPMARLL